LKVESDRDSVIKELKAQGKWKREDQIGNISNITGNENDIPQRLPLTFGPETLDKLKSGNKSSSGNESNKNHSVPGFGLLASFICLYVGWKLRKK
jgi:hypothetical protein